MPDLHASPPPSAAAARSSGAGKRFGRFQLLKLLGKSDRAMVWLVLDPRVGGELMLSLPRSAPVDDVSLQRWLRETQQAMRITHPRLTPAVETGSHERWPYIAVDRRLGITLAEWLEHKPRPDLGESVGWLVQVLEGLAFCHEAGVAHGDLQLHSLVVDTQGNASVMALASGGDVRQAGAEGGEAEPLRNPREAAEQDVLAAGLLLYRLLAGESALDEADTARAIQRMAPVGRDMVRLPWITPMPVPDALRAIANRATANQQRQRYLNARTMLRALQGWAETEGKDRGGPLALLIDRLRTVGHLPAMPGVTRRIERLAGREGQHTDEIAEEILQDMALSFELLRAVNAAQVQNAQLGGAAAVLTIRRCVAMLGLDGVRHAAASLRQWPGPLSESGAAAMDKTVQLVRLAALTAQRLRPAGYDAEVVYIVTVLQNLGRLLVQYHFPDEAEQIRQLMLPAPPQATAPVGAAPDATRGAQPGMSEQMASLAVLGVDIDALGSAVTRHWALGDEVLLMGRRLPLDRPVLTPDGDADLLRLTANAANEALDAMSAPATPQRKQMAISQVAQRYARVLGITVKDLQEALQGARRDLQSGPGAAAMRRLAPQDAATNR